MRLGIAAGPQVRQNATLSSDISQTGSGGHGASGTDQQQHQPVSSDDSPKSIKQQQQWTAVQSEHFRLLVGGDSWWNARADCVGRYRH